MDGADVTGKAALLMKGTVPADPSLGFEVDTI